MSVPVCQFQELVFERPITDEQAIRSLVALLCQPAQPRLVFEARGVAGRVVYLLGAADGVHRPVAETLKAAAVDLSAARRPVDSARQVVIRNRQRALDTEHLAAASDAILTALAATRAGEQLALQAVIGPRLPARVVPAEVRQPIPLSRLLVGSDSKLDSEARTALARKLALPGACLVLRLGVSAASPGRRQQLALGLLGALRQLAGPGLRVDLKPDSPTKFDRVAAPWFWPLRLNVAELAAVLAIPVGEEDLPGLPPVHPLRLPPKQPVFKPSPARSVIGRLSAPGLDGYLTRSTAASQHHTWVLGPTGVGKSTLLANLALADIAAGRGVVVIEPKGSLVEDILRRIPDDRTGDVVLLDPTDQSPVGLNILAGPGSSEVRTDEVVAVFHDLFRESWGPRTADIIYGAVATLARQPDASIVQVPLLLTNPSFRAPLVGSVAGDLGLASFWNQYQAWGDAQREQAIAPLMNKLRAVLMRPSLRAVLGQVRPRFDIREVFTRRRVLLVALRENQIGREAAGLLGSFAVSQLYAAAKERHTLPDRAKPTVGLYIDEVQNYLHLAGDLAEALAMARSAGLGLTLAHQFIRQLPKTMLAAFTANCLTKVCFQVGSDDAAAIAKGSERLNVLDFRNLPAFEVYAQVWEQGQVYPYASARTLPLPEPCADPKAIRSASRQRYGRQRDQVEAEFAQFGGDLGSAVEVDDGVPPGRNPRRANQPPVQPESVHTLPVPPFEVLDRVGSGASVRSSDRVESLLVNPPLKAAVSANKTDATPPCGGARGRSERRQL